MADVEEPRPSGTTTGTLMVVSGATNLMWSGAVFWCVPCFGTVAAFPAIVGIAEIVVGAAVIGREPSSRVQLVSLLGLISGVITANPFSIGLELGALVTQSNKPKELEG
ncbi:MAG: hypothetical protein AAGA48_10480 [Myxococcota bacterium]